MKLNMKQNEKTHLRAGTGFLIAFLLWTVLIRCVDVQAAGPNRTKVGFAAFNLWFHELTGVHMTIYTITDWLGLVPLPSAWALDWSASFSSSGGGVFYGSIRTSFFWACIIFW